jgi:TatD DNase family protein
MVYLDIHAHLDYSSYDENREKLIRDIEEKNMIVLSNTMNYDNYLKTKEMFKNTKNILVCPGLYPQDAEKISEEDFLDYLNFLREKKDEYIAIGEVGLDKHHTRDDNLFEIQVRRFKALCDLAVEIDKALIIHTRKAEEEILDIIEEYVLKRNFRKFNLHCFMGKKKFINRIKELNIYVSIPLTILNTQSFQILVKELNMNQILVETDSPFLNPNKEINTPLNVPLIYEKIAQIKNLDLREVENIVYMNYMKLFL